MKLFMGILRRGVLPLGAVVLALATGFSLVEIISTATGIDGISVRQPQLNCAPFTKPALEVLYKHVDNAENIQRVIAQLPEDASVWQCKKAPPPH